MHMTVEQEADVICVETRAVCNKCSVRVINLLLLKRDLFDQELTSVVLLPIEQSMVIRGQI